MDVAAAAPVKVRVPPIFAPVAITHAAGNVLVQGYNVAVSARSGRYPKLVSIKGGYGVGFCFFLDRFVIFDKQFNFYGICPKCLENGD